MNSKKKYMTWEERVRRAKNIRKAKAAVVTVLLLAASVTAMAVLHAFEIRVFQTLLWIFGIIGFVRVMLMLATWIDDLTIDNVEDGFSEQT